MNYRNITQRLFDSFAKHDVAYLKSLLTEDSFLTVDGGRTKIEGVETIAATIGTSFVLVPDLKVRVKRLLAEDNVTVSEVVRTGHHTGELPLPNGGTLPPTGNAVYLPEVVILEFQGGHIDSMSVYTDQQDVQRQFGIG